MLRRIPHADLEVITGEPTAEDYLAMQQRLGRFYLGDEKGISTIIDRLEAE